jgi:hypothetical protein
MPRSISTREQRRDANTAVIMLLAERWPKCFAVFEERRRPLKGRHPIATSLPRSTAR